MSQNLITLHDTIEKLLSKKGCPWDIEQTPSSLCDYLLEECFELIDAIKKDDAKDALEEMGDVIFLLALIAKKYQQNSEFSFDDAIKSARMKMIRRHPHVFAETEIISKEEQLILWEQIKRKERKNENKDDSPFSGIPVALPTLLKTYRIHSKSSSAGFSWEKTAHVLDKVHEEWQELDEAIESKNQEHMEEEFGDYLFTLVEYGRRYGIKANTALENANKKFLHRYELMIAIAKEQNLELLDLPIEEKEKFWNLAKQKAKQENK